MDESSVVWRMGLSLILLSEVILGVGSQGKGLFAVQHYETLSFSFSLLPRLWLPCMPTSLYSYFSSF